MISNSKINVFAINLRKRTDRRQHILKEFIGRNEFCFHLIEGQICEQKPRYGLWKTIVDLTKTAKKNQLEYFVLCEDDHIFTSNYSFVILIDCIVECKAMNADLMLGGVSWCDFPIQISDNIFMVESFTGLQFTLVFSNIYDRIITAEFEYDDVSDLKISSLSNNIFLLHPFISKQKEFGYSDLTMNNQSVGRVELLFEKQEMRLDKLKKVKNYLNLIQLGNE